MLEAEPDIAVVAEAGTADDARRYVLGHKPSILVLDLNMPGEPSLEVLPEILAASAGTKVIVLTMQSEPAFVRSALRAGASGYVVKHAAAKELVDAIRTTLAGEIYLNPTLGARLVAGPVDDRPDDLTARELEVLTFLAQGYMNPEIAERLTLSVRTIETHRANLQRKTGANSRAELTAYAKEHGLDV